jgi:hypothetical protein
MLVLSQYQIAAHYYWVSKHFVPTLPKSLFPVHRQRIHLEADQAKDLNQCHWTRLEGGGRRILYVDNFKA